MIRWRRTRAVAAKEFLHVFRDLRSLLLALVLPLFLLMLFGYALTLDVDRVPTLVLDNDRTPQSRELIERMNGSRYFSIVGHARDNAQVTRSLDDGSCLMAVTLLPGYGRGVLSGGETQVQVLVDGSDSNTASIALGYATALLTAFDGEIRSAAAQQRGIDIPATRVEARLRVWYNPELRARNYIVPGLIALIMTIIGALITSMTIAREYETGTMEQLLSTPVRPAEFMLGKIIPYFCIGLIDMAVSVLMGTVVFGVPLRGSALVLFFSSCVFLVGCLSLGLLISAATRSQSVAFQLGMLTSFLPSFLLSGFVYSIENMPAVIQVATHLVPARYFIVLLKGVFLKSSGVGLLWVEGAMLLAFSIIMFRLAVSRVKGKLA